MAKKRGNGEGSISCRKGGGWMAQYVMHRELHAGEVSDTIYVLYIL